MVEVDAAGSFGEQTIDALGSMAFMAMFMFENYGEKTKSMYSTYYEVKYAYDNAVRFPQPRIVITPRDPAPVFELFFSILVVITV